MSTIMQGYIAKDGKMVKTGGGSGGSGTRDYNDLTNKPQINGVELAGNKTTKELNIDIPTKLPNPNSITFTGGATGSYDGSSAVTIDIPQGGTGGPLQPLTFTGAVEAMYDGTQPVEVPIPTGGGYKEPKLVKSVDLNGKTVTRIEMTFPICPSGVCIVFKGVYSEKNGTVEPKVEFSKKISNAANKSIELQRFSVGTSPSWGYSNAIFTPFGIISASLSKGNETLATEGYAKAPAQMSPHIKSSGKMFLGIYCWNGFKGGIIEIYADEDVSN